MGMTIKELAKQVGVSTQAISLVLNGKSQGEISAATRDRILKAVEETGFRRNLNASRIRRSCCETITLVIDSVEVPGNDYEDFREPWMEVAAYRGVVESALAEGFDVKLLPLQMNDMNIREKLISRVGPPYSDGIVFMGMHYNKEIYYAVESQQIPHITIKMHLSVNAADISPVIVADPVEATRKAVRSLMASGHKQIAYCGHRNVNEAFLPQRFRGYEIEMRDAGIYDEKLILVCPDMYSIREMASSSSLKKKFTAIICTNDKMAYIWKKELEYKKYSIPDDFAIIGCDANPMYPGFSTIDLRWYDCGWVAGEKLIYGIKNKRPPESSNIIAEFVRGKTS